MSAQATALLRLKPSTRRDWRYHGCNLTFVKFTRRIFVLPRNVQALIEWGVELVSQVSEG
jgi:hypothetical protein